DGFVVGIAGGLQFLLLEVEIAQLFIVSCRRVVADGCLKLSDALTAGEAFERLTGESDIGQRFGKEVDGCADGSQKQDDVDPIVVRPPANEMDDRQSLEYQAPRVEKMTQDSHGCRSLWLGENRNL